MSDNTQLLAEARKFFDEYDERSASDPVPAMLFWLIEALEATTAMLSAEAADIETLTRFRTYQEVALRIADLRPRGFMSHFRRSDRERDEILWEAQKIPQREENRLRDEAYRITHPEENA